MKKAFIYRRGGLGDTLLIFPLLEILKKEGYELTLSGNRDYLRLGLELGWIDRIVSEPDGIFDLSIIIGLSSTRDNSVKIVRPFPQKKEWIVEYYLRELGFREGHYSKLLPFNNLTYRVSPEEERLFRERVIIHPSSGSKKKNLPPSLFLKIAELFPEALFVAGEADRWISQYVEPFYFDHDILRTAALLKRARLFIGADSGLGHLSAYLGVKTVVIYGPTDSLVWKPVGEKVIQIRPSRCKPCFPRVCKERHCLEGEDNIDEILSILKNQCQEG